MMRALILSTLLIISSPSNAWMSDGGAGWANYGVIIKILTENIKRYQQLQLMIRQAKDGQELLKLVNEGINNAIGIMQVLPIKDEKIIEEFKNYSTALNKIDQIYGKIPKSDDAKMQLLHDKTIAEALKLANSLDEYTKTQEDNANLIHSQSRHASPKGAMRMNAQTNAQILHSLNQLIKINGQILKLQSEKLAVINKESKDSSGSFNKTRNDLKGSMNMFKTDLHFPQFN